MYVYLVCKRYIHVSQYNVYIYIDVLTVSNAECSEGD